MAARPVIGIGSSGAKEEVDLEAFPTVELPNANAPSGTAFVLDLWHGATRITPTGDFTISIAAAPPTGRGIIHTLVIVDGGQYTCTWPSGCIHKTSGGTPPALSADGEDDFALMHVFGALRVYPMGAE